ncbi:MAG: hypothetical protein ACK5SX_14970 [Sandaracinobacter sp.]
MKSWIALVLSTAFAGSAVANPFISEGRTPDMLIPEIVNACIDNGDAVIDTNPYMVACEAMARQTVGTPLSACYCMAPAMPR